MKLKRICVSYIVLCLIVCFISGCGSSKKPEKVEEEIVAYLNELAGKYGEIGYDAQYVYCDGEYQYFVIYYYGTGTNTKTPNTTAVYRVDKDGNSEMYLDFMEEKVELEASFDKVLLATCEDKYNEYKNDKRVLTYEEFKNFEEGCMNVDFDILHELTKKE